MDLYVYFPARLHGLLKLGDKFTCLRTHVVKLRQTGLVLVSLFLQEFSQ
jgi:hypothetical protein